MDSCGWQRARARRSSTERGCPSPPLACQRRSIPLERRRRQAAVVSRISGRRNADAARAGAVAQRLAVCRHHRAVVDGMVASPPLGAPMTAREWWGASRRRVTRRRLRRSVWRRRTGGPGGAMLRPPSARLARRWSWGPPLGDPARVVSLLLIALVLIAVQTAGA